MMILAVWASEFIGGSWGRANRKAARPAGNFRGKTAAHGSRPPKPLGGDRFNNRKFRQKNDPPQDSAHLTLVGVGCQISAVLADLPVGSGQRRVKRARRE
jgi:hypothetical protein